MGFSDRSPDVKPAARARIARSERVYALNMPVINSMSEPTPTRPRPKRSPRKTTRDLVADSLRGQILRNELPPGSRLSVPEIALDLGVSQTPAREALQLLEGEGIVQIDAYRGVRVAELNLDDCEEIYVLRAALEGFAARIGTERISEAEIDSMAATLEGMRES